MGHQCLGTAHRRRRSAQPDSRDESPARIETAAQIDKRIDAANSEMADWKKYRYTILSSSMEEDLIKFRAIIRAERYLSRRLNLHHG